MSSRLEDDHVGEKGNGADEKQLQQLHWLRATGQCERWLKVSLASQHFLPLFSVQHCLLLPLLKAEAFHFGALAHLLFTALPMDKKVLLA